MHRREREYAFMRAILADAVHCLLGIAAGSRRDRHRLEHQARVWITEDESTAPLGFEDVCHALDLDPPALRRRLLALADRAAGGTPHDLRGIDSAFEALTQGGFLRSGVEPIERTSWVGKTERNAEMLGLRRAGWSLRALAERFGVSVSRACTICMQAARTELGAKISVSRRSARRSDAGAPPSAAGSPAPASRSARRPQFPAAAEGPPPAGADTPAGFPRRARAER
jgi:hypothetical protein